MLRNARQSLQRDWAFPDSSDGRTNKRRYDEYGAASDQNNKDRDPQYSPPTNSNDDDSASCGEINCLNYLYSLLATNLQSACQP